MSTGRSCSHRAGRSQGVRGQDARGLPVNPAEVVAQTGSGRGILGVVEGGAPVGVETDRDVQEREELLRRFRNKL